MRDLRVSQLDLQPSNLDFPQFLNVDPPSVYSIQNLHNSFHRYSHEKLVPPLGRVLRVREMEGLNVPTERRYNSAVG